MDNKEKATKIMETFTEVYGVNIERDSHIYSACMQMAQWKDEQFKQLLIEKTKLLSPSAAQDSVKRCTIEEIYREMFNEEILNSNPYYKKVGEYKTTTK